MFSGESSFFSRAEVVSFFQSFIVYFDLRRILVPPVAPFLTIQIPSIVNQQSVTEAISTFARHLHPIAGAYLRGNQVGPGASTANSAPTRVCKFLFWNKVCIPRSDYVRVVCSALLHAVVDNLCACHCTAGQSRRNKEACQHSNGTARREPLNQLTSHACCAQLNLFPCFLKRPLLETFRHNSNMW